MNAQSIQQLQDDIAHGKTFVLSREAFRGFFADQIPDDFHQMYTTKYAPMINEESAQAILDLRINRPSIPKDSLRCPTLVISGGHDPQILSAWSRDLATYLNADCLYYATAGHMMLWQNNAPATVSDIENWLIHR